MKSQKIIFYFFITFFFFGCFTKSKKEIDKYQHYIGYINQEKVLLNDGYLCNKDEIYFTFKGAGSDGYKGTKKRFRDTILSKYKHQLYKDSGYISFRFLVNCRGEAGWFEISEMNLDLGEKNLDNKMVQELLDLTSKKGNWNVFGFNEKEGADYYMYLIYRIENGKITEILP